MRAAIIYLQQHPWQRRLLTVLVALVLAAAIALPAYPRIRDYLLLRDLGSDNAGVRAAAIDEAVRRAGRSPATLDRLRRALETDDDRQFHSVAVALMRLGEFRRAARDATYADRLRALQLESPAAGAEAAYARMLQVRQLLLSGRDNPYVRRALKAAARDGDTRVRAMSAPLAARVADEASLRSLLQDVDASVAGAAALGAGLLETRNLAPALTEAMRSRADREVVSSAAWALARLQPQTASALIRPRLKETADPLLRDRLLHVMMMLADEGAKEAVRDVLSAARKANRPFPAQAMLAGARLKLPQAGVAARDILAAAGTEGSDVSVRQLLAALRAAGALHADVRTEVEALCRRLRPARYPLISARAARLLARQVAAAPPANTEAPSREQCIRTLQQLATWRRRVEGNTISAPLPSAAAAVGLWELGAPQADMFVRAAAAMEDARAGDYIAWHLGRTGRPEAFELGMAMLPAPDAPLALRVYNDWERATGAMLLAFSARTIEQKRLAVERIASRLTGGTIGAEDNPMVRSAYRCGLVILGRREHLESVVGMLDIGAYPKRRVFSALCAARDRAGVDWLLCSMPLDDELTAEQLEFLGFGDVLAAAAPELPRVDAAAPDDLRFWQVRILRTVYALRREALELRLRK